MDENEEVVEVQEGETGDESVTLSKAEFEKLNQTIGAYKKEIKDFKKGKEETPTQSNEPDYAKIAYLQTSQVTHPDDQNYVMAEANRLKMPLTDILQMEHVKAKLASENDARVSQDGMPKGSGRTGKGGKGDVEYYLAHENEIPPTLELHNKVIDARMKQQSDDNKFSSVPFIG